MASETDPLSPDEAFRLLGDGTRLSILRAVWEAPDETATFTELRERVGSPDSGAFNYHLNKLAGQFLASVDGGYRLTQAGRAVVRAVLAGTMTERPETGPAPIAAACTACGGELRVRYDEHAIVECEDCGETVMWNEFPPAGLEGRTPAAVAAAFDRWTRGRFRLAMDGVCPNCAAGMSTELLKDDVATMHRCGNCKYEARVPLVGHVARHPAVVAFYHEAGVDVLGMPYWDLRDLAGAHTATVVSEDPWRLVVALEADGRTLEVTLDGRLDVVGAELTAR